MPRHSVRGVVLLAVLVLTGTELLAAQALVPPSSLPFHRPCWAP